MADSFSSWLLAQGHRPDAVGLLSRHIRFDPRFPRDARRLTVFLKHFETTGQQSLREFAKKAHAEWRRGRVQ